MACLQSTAAAVATVCRGLFQQGEAGGGDGGGGGGGGGGDASGEGWEGAAGEGAARLRSGSMDGYSPIAEQEAAENLQAVVRTRTGTPF